MSIGGKHLSGLGVCVSTFNSLDHVFKCLLFVEGYFLLVRVLVLYFNLGKLLIRGSKNGLVFDIGPKR